MKLAKSSHQRLESFFREYLDDENFSLPPVVIYAGKFTGALTKTIKVLGITVGKRIFILPEIITFNKHNLPKLPEELVAHEIAHVLQYQRTGFFVFIKNYLRDYWTNLLPKEKWDAAARRQAYLEIPFEIEAREIAAKFVEWNRKNK